MYAPRGAVPESPAENAGEDDVIIVRRGGGRRAQPSGEDEVVRAERTVDIEEAPKKPSLIGKLLSAPGKALKRTVGYIGRHPLNSALTFAGTTGLLALAKHTGALTHLTNLAPEGTLRTVVSAPGDLSHRMWSFAGGRTLNLTPGWVSTPVQGFFDLVGKNGGFLGPTPAP